ncbi:caspase-2-like protein [Dinothrombium tinctorium]|uniref:Caspase-2-like protein n=1 Tax=Dinothrombium tinctorium TaxID=1965070 RepID=A0A3S3P322_9ACAR|nr:caspase-2-like protein [Dinothrombium tinctorium]RWR99801.1 caspase-2-like protein [Dinothrombium tinctorium]
MNEEDRKTIRDNIPNLVDVLDFNAILPLLSFKRLFTTPMIEQLNAHRNEREKKLVLLSDLRKRGPTAFQDFVDLLAITAQHKALQFLKPEV